MISKIFSRRASLLLAVLSCFAVCDGDAVEQRDWTEADIRLRLHAPLTAPADAIREQIFSPQPYAYVEPMPLCLPSKATLKTIEIRDRAYVIRKAPSRKEVAEDRIKAEGFARFDKPDEALFFQGSGGGGLQSRERLIVENCTFVLDFQEGDFDAWDDSRCAIRIEGYNEVLIRNCVFISRTTQEQEIRRTVGSIVAYDCQKVQIEECFFAGRTTGWRGHVLVFCCGPTSIRNIEVRGTRQGDQWSSGGGIWVASGVGEGKIGVIHEQEPDRMIYPPGPLLIENAWIHDQTSRENNDGIYIQSVQPFLVRNSKLSNWRDDALMDVGFRDTAGKNWKDAKLLNHGAVGVVEHCEFDKGDSKSFVKNSVGAAGGIVFRNNLLRDVWVMPYIFDGGTWTFVGNAFVDLSGPAICGDDGRGGGWEPGMLREGSRMVFFNNLFQAKPGAKMGSLIRSKNAAALPKGLIMDYNVYDLNGGTVQNWLADDAKKVDCPSLEEWKKLSGSDAHSILGTETLESFKNVKPDTLTLPGGIPMSFGPAKAGLTGPVGVTNPEVLAKGKALVDAFEKEYAAANPVFQIEDLPVVAKTLSDKMETRKFSGGMAWLVVDGKVGDAITFQVSVEQPRRFYVTTETQPAAKAGLYQFSVNGQIVGAPGTIAQKGTVSHGAAAFNAGENTVTYTLDVLGNEGGGAAALDSLRLRDADLVDREAAATRAKADQAADRKAAATALEAKKIILAIPDAPVVGKTRGHVSMAASKDVNYRLWQPAGEGDGIAFEINVPKAGVYAVGVTTHAQQDAGQIKLEVDSKVCGTPQNLGGILRFGEVDLSQGRHTFALALIQSGKGPAEKIKVRLRGIELLPK